MRRDIPSERVGRSCSSQRSGLLRHVARLFGAALSAATLVGCFPAMVRHSPEIAGSLSLDGVAVKEAQVFVSGAGEACNASEFHDVTDEQGLFVVPAERHLELYSPFMLGDPLFSWRVCFDYKGRYYLALTEFSHGSVPERIRLECDIGADPAAMKFTPNPYSLCRVQERLP